MTREKWHQAVKNRTYCSCYLRVVGGYNWGLLGCLIFFEMKFFKKRTIILISRCLVTNLFLQSSICPVVCKDRLVFNYPVSHLASWYSSAFTLGSCSIDCNFGLKRET